MRGKQIMKIIRLFGCLLVCMILAKNSYAGGSFNQEQGSAHQWLGTYAGVTIGYTRSGASIERGTSRNDFDINRDAVLLGGVLGRNFSYIPSSSRGGWLFGTEVELTGLGGKHSKTDAVLGEVEIDAKWMASFRLRAGYAWDNLYLYGLAGIAVSDVDVYEKGQKNKDDIHATLLLGVGAEYALSKKWAARVDGMIVGLGEDDISFSGVDRETARGVGTIRAGFTRKF